VVDIFDEVEEELRAERAQKLLMRYGGVLIAIVVGIVAAAGAWKGWQWWQAKQDAAAAVSYIRALDGADTRNGAAEPNALATFYNLAVNAPSGYRVLSRLNAAALKARAGDLTGATAMWDQVASDTSADPVLRDLASLLWAQHQIDKGDPSVISARLQGLIGPDKPWSALAQEQLALLKLRQGQDAAAKAAFQKLADDPTAPASARARYSALVARLGG
jgi:hypothetical protein